MRRCIYIGRKKTYPYGLLGWTSMLQGFPLHGLYVFIPIGKNQHFTWAHRNQIKFI